MCIILTDISETTATALTTVATVSTHAFLHRRVNRKDLANRRAENRAVALNCGANRLATDRLKLNSKLNYKAK